uniref:Secreted protein n=1 Tax=Oryza meridionalis TaxID=40149 RepID=A0A0E0EB07_9ORYZ
MAAATHVAALLCVASIAAFPSPPRRGKKEHVYPIIGSSENVHRAHQLAKMCHNSQLFWHHKNYGIATFLAQKIGEAREPSKQMGNCQQKEELGKEVLYMIAFEIKRKRKNCI